MKSVAALGSGKSKFKELRLLIDKIKGQFTDSYDFPSLPSICTSELYWLDLRDLGTWLVRLSGEGKGGERDLAVEIETYSANQSSHSHKKATKSFISEMSRVYNNNSSSVANTSQNKKSVQITSYSLPDEKFDMFTLPVNFLEKLKSTIGIK